MHTINNVSFSTKFAIGSFAIGTLLLLTYLTTRDGILLYIGLVYVIGALVLNSIIALMLLYELLVKKEEREETAIRLFILLSNLPIAYFYMTLVFSHI